MSEDFRNVQLLSDNSEMNCFNYIEKHYGELIYQPETGHDQSIENFEKAYINNFGYANQSTGESSGEVCHQFSIDNPLLKKERNLNAETTFKYDEIPDEKFPSILSNTESNEEITLDSQVKSKNTKVAKRKRSTKKKKEERKKPEKIIKEKGWRKKKADGIRKKVKVNFFHKYIKGKLNNYLKYYFPSQKYEFNKLNQIKIAKIDIKFNSEFLDSNVAKIFSEPNATQKEKVRNPFHNKYLMDLFLSIMKNNKELKIFLYSPLKIIYENFYYKNDQTYFDLLEENDDPKDPDYIKLFKETTNDFFKYFFETKANEKTKKEN